MMPINLPSSLLALALASTGALAHMQMLYPPILMGKYNDAIPMADKDWNPQNPLAPDGSNFPCHGWIGKDKHNVGSLQAGQVMNFSLIGTTPSDYVPHGGGSCQAALSYDSGKTWSTIWSYMGGCVLDATTYDVLIPADAPSGEVLFAWDWFNLQGNREMYQNCALMTITGGGAGLNDKKAYPPPFVANVGNGCATIEGVNVVFPSPGNNVHYGGVYASSHPTTPTGYTGSNCVPAGQVDAGPYDGAPAASSLAAASSAAASSKPATTSTSTAAIATSPAATTPAVVKPTTSSAAAVPSASASSSAASVPTGAVHAGNPVKVCRRRKRAVQNQALVNETSSDKPAADLPEQQQEAKRGFFSNPHGGLERRHERLVRRKRVAALPAGRPAGFKG